MTNTEAMELGGGHGHDDAHIWLRELDDDADVVDAVTKAIRESLASSEAPSDELINALLPVELAAQMGMVPKRAGSWTPEALSWFEGYDKAWRVVLETRLAELTS